MEREIKPKIEIVAKVIDPATGKIIEERKIEGRSFLRNFAALCHVIFWRGDYNETDDVTDIGGVARSIVRTSALSTSVGTGYETYVCVGTNSTAVSRDQYYCLTAVGTAKYSTFSYQDTGTAKQVTYTFSWLNNTGAAQSIAEVCLIVLVRDTTPADRWVALTRDLFSPPISVPAGSVLSVGYIITIPW